MTSACPAWCERRSEDHPAEGGIVVHSRRVGTLGVLVEWLPDDPNSPWPITYVPELLVLPSGYCPAPRVLASDLLAAADLIDAANG